MSKIYKSSNITVDENNRVNIISNHVFENLDEKPEEEVKTAELEKEETIEENKAQIDETIEIEETNEETLFQCEAVKIKAEQIASEIISNANTEAEKIIADAEKLIQEAEIKAQEILQKAEEDALKKKEEMILTAENEKLSILEKAESEGREKGYAEGYQDGHGESEALKLEAEEIKKEAIIYKEKLIENTEPEIVELILNIVRKLIADEIEINPEVILFLLRKSLRQVSVTGNISVNVSSDDYPTVMENKDAILSTLETMARIDFIEDSTLKKTECIIETAIGGVNCKIDEQFKELEKSMYFLLKNR